MRYSQSEITIKRLPTSSLAPSLQKHVVFLLYYYFESSRFEEQKFRSQARLFLTSLGYVLIQAEYIFRSDVCETLTC